MALFGATTAMAQEKGLDHFGQIADMKDFTNKPTQKLALERLSDCLDLIRAFKLGVELKDYSLSGSTSFSANTAYANGRPLQALQVALAGQYTAGTYPYQLDISGGIQLKDQNGTVIEELSDFDVSFDYNLLWRNSPNSRNGHRLRWEIFGFLDRTSNSYMGVTRRYQGGSGIVLNVFSKKVIRTRSDNKYVPFKTTSRQQQLQAINFSRPDYGSSVNESAIAKTYDDLIAKLSSAEQAVLRKQLDKERLEMVPLQRGAAEMIRKKYFRHRFAVLWEILVEDDLIEYTDTLRRFLTYPEGLGNELGATTTTQEFRNTARLRAGNRLKYEFQSSSGVSGELSVFAFAAPPLGQLHSVVEPPSNAPEQVKQDRRVDIRIMVPADVKYAASDVVEVGLSFKYIAELAPQRRYVSFTDEGSGTVYYGLFEAPSEFWMFQVKVNIKV
ncbi:MAG: hypothetical protein H6594_06510 [Flavobacteriales bacterium]|nr:hypothetical protein [Flavobacteriales bacterium]